MKTNIEKLMEFIPDTNTCAVVTSQVNRRYFTGFKTSSGTLICFKEKAYFIVDFRYFEKACEIVKDCEVILEKERTVQINELMKKHCTSTAMIEAEKMTVNQLGSFRESFPKINVDFSNTLSNGINNMRILKNAYEIEKISAAQKIADETFEYVIQNISEGMTERDIALMIDNRMKFLGAEDISFETIALCGKNTSLPHGVPGYDKVSGNCFILMDFGAVVDGLHSDMTRTVYFGTPSEAEKEAYNIVLSAQLRALEAIKPGMTCKQLDFVAREYIDSTAYKGAFGHSLGHGVGMEIHEKPAVSQRNNDTVIEKGMVITIEPGIYIPGKFGIRIEDKVVITDDSYMNFTGSPKEFIVL